MPTQTQTETSLVELRDEITRLREGDAEIPLECGVSLFESHLKPLEAPSKLLLFDVLESTRVPVVSIDIHHCALMKSHEERDEILCFIKYFQSQITSFKLHGVTTNDFVLAWWIERIFVGTSFLPRLRKFHISTKIIINSAVAVRLCEAIIQSVRSEFESVHFRPSHHPSTHDVIYLATLLSQAYENVLATQQKISHRIGQYAFAVLEPMLPYNRLVFCFSPNHVMLENTLPFFFDERILSNNALMFNDMTLQQFTENYTHYERYYVELYVGEE